MRRGAPFMLLAILLSSCAGAQGPSQAVPAASVTPAIGLDDVVARQAVRDFVQAYANSPTDGGRSLAALADGALMFRWVRWLSVQNAVFPGSITGHARIDSVGALHTLPNTAINGVTNPLSALILSATVTFDYAPAGGTPFTKTVSLDGPIFLQPVSAESWHVLAFTRDGSNLEQFVTPVDDAQTADGVDVTFDTLITSSNQWVIGIRIANHSSVDIQPKDAALTDPNGSVIGQVGLAAPSTISPGSTVSVLAGLAAPAITGEAVVAVRIDIGGTVRAFGVPLSRLLKNALNPPTPTPAPTPAQTPTPTPS